ncbi:MAG: GIY-YIG nuclease family protein [Kiritimatiellota bacterium]|nr:GIY-YIG nuclease family protein [Kiritimatiellota bacterium]
MKSCYVYILASKRNGTLYIGITNSLVRRVCEHKNDLTNCFSKRYHIHTLVYYQHFDDVKFAIQHEKRLKKWNRKWKLALIEENNPEWKDLYEDLT